MNKHESVIRVAALVAKMHGEHGSCAMLIEAAEAFAQMERDHHAEITAREQVQAEMAQLRQERDALAAHVCELVKGGRALHDELQQWSLTERDPDTSAAMAKWRTAVGEQPSLSPLYRRDARMKAEALEEFENRTERFGAIPYSDLVRRLQVRAYQYRQQAEGDKQ